MRDTERVIGVILFLFVPFICYYFAKKNDRRNYSWRDISWIILFSYLWSFLNIFIHECGHALTAFGFGNRVYKISVDLGWKLFSFSSGQYTKITFQVLPVGGYASIGIRGMKEEVITLAMGVITQFIFLGLVYWLLKKNEDLRKTLIGHFCYHYAIKIAFWLTFIINFPFVISNSDWTRIAKIAFGWN